MIKLVCLINRPLTVAREPFARWWLDHHAGVASRLPGLRRYTISLTRPEDDAPFDGVAELWFDDADAMERAFASEAGRLCAREDQECIGRRLTFVTDEHVITHAIV